MIRAVILALTATLAASQAAAQTSAPALFVERDGDAVYLRVETQRFSPFGARPPEQRVADRQLGRRPGDSFTINTPASVLIEHVVADHMKHGVRLDHTRTVSIYDYRYQSFDGGGGIYGAAIKLGASGGAEGPTYIQRVIGDGAQAPDASYHRSNTDFIGVELNSGEVLIRDVTGRRFGDAGVDSKSGPVYIMNATLEHTHRALRAWGGVEITIANSIVNAAPNHAQIWLADATASVRYYNVLWCQGASNPAPGDPHCRMQPWLIEGDDMDAQAAARRVTELSANPLPRVSPFFGGATDAIVIEYSSDHGAHWRPMRIANAGDDNGPPRGDPRFRVSADLDAANVWFRARTRQDGALGPPSRTVTGNGAGPG